MKALAGVKDAYAFFTYEGADVTAHPQKNPSQKLPVVGLIDGYCSPQIVTMTPESLARLQLAADEALVGY
ncbi:hypothetical protein [Actinomyces vulturis]|uniref:hypothetical protein n=1 Tax=Actinomyces vulturis TaxID=1857645 RepID=UPI0011469C1B|nr:hypothetical protein [Actinomyces vulturis]